MQRMLGVLAFLMCYLHYSHGVKSSCMATPVKFGDDATISCHFEEDMSKLQRDVLVYLNKDNNEHPVVMYAWHDGQAKVLMMEGYRCEGNISDYLVIKIANVKENNAGQYNCLVALSNDESTKCTLRITGLPPHTTVESVTNRLLDHHASDWNNLRIVSIVVGALFGVLVAIFLAILIIAISHRWIPTCCCTQKHQDSLKSNATKNGNLKHIYKSTPIYKLNTKLEEDNQKLVEPV